MKHSHDPVVREAIASIDDLRQQIDAVDAALLHALAQRMELVKQIGYHKQAASLAPVQPDRWMKVVEHRQHLGRSLQLNERFVLALFELIHDESINLQDQLMQSLLEKVS